MGDSAGKRRATYLEPGLGLARLSGWPAGSLLATRWGHFSAMANRADGPLSAKPWATWQPHGRQRRQREPRHGDAAHQPHAKCGASKRRKGKAQPWAQPLTFTPALTFIIFLVAMRRDKRDTPIWGWGGAVGAISEPPARGRGPSLPSVQRVCPDHQKRPYLLSFYGADALFMAGDDCRYVVVARTRRVAFGCFISTALCTSTSTGIHARPSKQGKW